MKGFYTGEGEDFNSLLKGLAAEVPMGLKSEQALFDELAHAPVSGQAAVAGRISTAIGKHLSEEQKWHFAVGEKLIVVAVEVVRLSNDKPSGSDGPFDVETLRTQLRDFKKIVDSSPPGLAPEKLTRLRNIGLFAEKQNLDTRDRLFELTTAFADFMDHLPI